MKRRFIHLQLTFVFACMLLFALTICSYAAEGFEGYAVYRDGAFLGTTWHGGLMDGAHPKRKTGYTCGTVKEYCAEWVLGFVY